MRHNRLRSRRRPRRSNPWPRAPSPRSPPRRRTPSAGSARSRRRSPTATGRRPRRSSPPTATGATSSRSRGTSRPSRAGRASPTWWSTRPGRGRPRLPRHRAGRRGRRHRRGLVHLRDRGRPRPRAPAPQGRQGLDAADHHDELKGHEEPRGPARPRGVEHGAEPDRETWLERKPARGRGLGVTTQPYVVIIGGGQGGIGLGARLKRLGVPTIIVDRNPRPGDQWRNRYKSLCLHDPVWYDHLPYLHVPRALARLLAEGQDRRLARDVHARHGAQLLGLDRGQARELGSRGAGVDRAGRARGTRVTLRPKHSSSRRACRPAQPAPAPGHGRLPGRQCHSSKHPGPDGYRGKKRGRDRLEQLRARHLRRPVGARRRRDHGAAVVHATSCVPTR